MNPISTCIRNRRSIKPESFTDVQIPDSKIHEILENALWAPTHGRTEPWSFYVFSKEGRITLGNYLYQAYMNHTEADLIDAQKAEKLRNRPLLASHVICVAMIRGNNAKIPAQEELIACGSAVQNILLSTEAKSYAAFWSTGAMIYTDTFKRYFNLRPEDQIVALIYMGGKPEGATTAGKRNHSLEEKCTFFS